MREDHRSWRGLLPSKISGVKRLILFLVILTAVTSVALFTALTWDGGGTADPEPPDRDKPERVRALGYGNELASLLCPPGQACRVLGAREIKPQVWQVRLSGLAERPECHAVYVEKFRIYQGHVEGAVGPIDCDGDRADTTTGETH